MRDRAVFFTFLFIISAMLIWGVIYPNISIVIASLQRADHWTMENYRAIVSSKIILRAAWNSVWISIATVIGSAIIGVGMALLFQFLDFPGRRLFAALAPLPMLLPPLIGVIAFIFLYGESGIISRALMRACALSAPPWRLNGPGAILAVHIYSMYAYFYIFASAGLQRLDYSFLEAAQTLGASRLRIFFTVLLPLLRPALTGAALLTFMNSMASFSAPYLFGGGTPMLTLQIFNAKVSGQWELSMAESVLLSAISLSALFWLQRHQQETAGGSKGAARRQTIHRGSLRALATAGGSLAIIIILLPPLTLLLMSFAKDGSWTMEILPPAYTLENYYKVFANPAFAEPIRNSLMMSGLAAGADLLLALPAAYLLTRARFIGQRWLAALLLAPWALPGTVLALSFAASFSRPSLFNGGLVLIGTFWILPIIYFLRNLPLVTRSIQANLEQLEGNLEEASRSLGANFFYTLRRVIIPLIWPGAISGGALAFATAMGEFVASVIVYVPSSRPISVEIAAQLRYFQVGSASVYGVILIILIAISLTVGWRLAGLDTKSLGNAS
jgi:iron(III) transport system permease protein